MYVVWFGGVGTNLNANCVCVMLSPTRFLRCRNHLLLPWRSLALHQKLWSWWCRRQKVHGFNVMPAAGFRHGIHLWDHQIQEPSAGANQLSLRQKLKLWLLQSNGWTVNMLLSSRNMLCEQLSTLYAYSASSKVAHRLAILNPDLCPELLVQKWSPYLWFDQIIHLHVQQFCLTMC